MKAGGMKAGRATARQAFCFAFPAGAWRIADERDSANGCVRCDQAILLAGAAAGSARQAG